MSRKRGARFLVEGVNLGNGEPARCWLIIGTKAVSVRRYRGRRVWSVTLAEAAGIVARRAQVERANAGRA